MTHTTGDPFATLPADRKPMGMAKDKAKGKAGGRWQTVNGFIDGIMGTLTPAAVATWLVLFRDTKRNGLAQTSQADIARRAGVSDRAVRDALRELRNHGLVAVVRRGGVGRGPSAYRVRLAAASKRK